MRHLRPDEWQPVGVESLEPAAELVVRSTTNALVVAGPGAGKTELLAQRASFLLQTGTCPAPWRILAISFKRDAAKNLAERVQARCGNAAARFDSYTLDAFAKGLVDRFLPAIPHDWRPHARYEVDPGGPTRDQKRDWLSAAGTPAGYRAVNVEGFSHDQVRLTFDRMAHGFRLPYDDPDVPALARYWGLQWWRNRLEVTPGEPSLSFPMLNRLAAYLFRRNPKLLRALQETYAFVFLDEFQDTTSAQYDLVKTGFRGSAAILTAVGDDKQRIMAWAGAMPDAFGVYQRHFVATRHQLLRNYRSAPELVKMQHVIAQTLEDGVPPAEAAVREQGGSCLLLEFATPEDEAAHLAELIANGLSEGLKPRNFCVLARQRTADFIRRLESELRDNHGIKLRDESRLQDLLSEPVVELLLAALRLATRDRDPEAWESFTTALRTIHGATDDNDAQVEVVSESILKHTRQSLSSGLAVHDVPSKLLEKLGEASLRNAYPQYRAGQFLQKVVEDLSEVLKTAAERSPSAGAAVDDLVGEDVVPAMTIHRSKGLEFHTVIFMGLEDSQWWNFRNQPDEEKRSFFVAFSRAITQVYFTFSDVRVDRWKGRRQQRRDGIAGLYTTLRAAGVPTVDHRPHESL